MKLAYTDIIIAPLITEKSTDLKDKQRMLCFKVHKNANKITVKIIQPAGEDINEGGNQ